MKKLLAVFLCIVMALGVMTGCGDNGPSGDDTAGDNPSGGKDSVSICCESVISTLDPYATLAYTSWYVFNQIYETLVTVDDDGNIQPCLATDWSVSDDGLTYTFNLVEGAKFHNGDTFTAEDAAYSITTAMAAPAMNAYTNMIASAEASGDNVLTIKLKRLYASFVSMMSEIPMVCKAFYSAQSNNYDVGCGTGPYMLTEDVDLNNEVVMTRFEDYRLGPASIKDIHLKVITDATTSVVTFETGDLDFLTVYNISSVASLQENEKYEFALCPTLHTAYITLNNEVAPLDNQTLRQALSYAVDYDTVIEVAYEGLAARAYALMGENSFGADFSECVKYEYNPEKAQELLAEAGYPDGIDFSDFGIEFDYIPGSYHEKIAQCIQQTWSECGIKISLRANDNIDSDAPAGNYAIGTEGGTYTSDMAFMAACYATSGIDSNNYARYSNPTVDELFEKADAITDETARKAYYKEICNIVSEAACYIPIQHKGIPYVWYKDLNAVVHLSSAHGWYVYEWSWKTAE